MVGSILSHHDMTCYSVLTFPFLFFVLKCIEEFVKIYCCSEGRETNEY